MNPFPTPRKVALSLSAGALALGVLAGCGGNEPPGSSPSPTPTPTDTGSMTPSLTPTPTPTEDPGLVINATIRGDDLDPNGERVKARVGETITIIVDADRAGELHVHSTPEQELAYGTGKTRLELVIDTPGIVEVEDHVADKLLVSLEVS